MQELLQCVKAGIHLESNEDNIGLEAIAESTCREQMQSQGLTCHQQILEILLLRETSLLLAGWGAVRPSSHYIHAATSVDDWPGQAVSSISSTCKARRR